MYLEVELTTNIVESIVAIVMDATTGEILALSSYPQYDRSLITVHTKVKNNAVSLLYERDLF